MQITLEAQFGRNITRLVSICPPTENWLGGHTASMAERLAFLWRINKSDTDPDPLLGEDKHVDRVAIDNACYAPVDRHVL